MTREEKHAKRKARAEYRRKVRMTKYIEKIDKVQHLPYGVPLSAGEYGSWPDPNSPTGYSQVCSYEAYGICQSPCNGDC
jgi:hypothetical protein